MCGSHTIVPQVNLKGKLVFVVYCLLGKATNKKLIVLQLQLNILVL